jgi:hypothetical protein
MEESILLTIKKLLGLGEDYTAFDTDVITRVNTFLFTLTQLGVGPSTGFRITGPGETWSHFIGDRVDLEAVKDFIYMKARIVFDPPTSSAALQALKDEAKELEFRINIQVD